MADPKSKKVWWSILILASLILMNAVWHSQEKRNRGPSELRPDLVGAGQGAGNSDGTMLDQAQPGPEEMQSNEDLPPQQVFLE